MKSALIDDTNFYCRFMRNREPYEIKNIMIGYNLFQTLFSFWGFSEGWKYDYVKSVEWTFV